MARAPTRKAGVSPVVATILLIAITVVAVGVVGAFVVGIIPSEPPVIATIDIDGASENSTVLVIHHTAGNPIEAAFIPSSSGTISASDWAAMEVRVNGAKVAATNVKLNGSTVSSGTAYDFEAGDILTLGGLTALPSGGVVTVIYKPANQVLKTVEVRGTATGTPTPTPTPTPTGGPYTLTVSVSPDGSGSVSVSPSPVNGTYAAGTVVALSPKANVGYFFSHWSGDNNKDNRPNRIVMDGNKSVVANFKQAGICLGSWENEGENGGYDNILGYWDNDYWWDNVDESDKSDITPYHGNATVGEWSLKADVVGGWHRAAVLLISTEGGPMAGVDDNKLVLALLDNIENWGVVHNGNMTIHVDVTLIADEWDINAGDPPDSTHWAKPLEAFVLQCGGSVGGVAWDVFTDLQFNTQNENENLPNYNVWDGTSDRTFGFDIEIQPTLSTVLAGRHITWAKLLLITQHIGVTTVGSFYIDGVVIY